MSGFKSKFTKFNFGWVSAPDFTGGADSALPDPLAGFKGPTSMGREGRGREGRRMEREGCPRMKKCKSDHPT